MLEDYEEGVTYGKFDHALLYVYKLFLGEADSEGFNIFKRF
jgi:hypothetical protein